MGLVKGPQHVPGYTYRMRGKQIIHEPNNKSSEVVLRAGIDILIDKCPNLRAPRAEFPIITHLNTT